MLQRKTAERTAYFLLDMGQSNRMKRRGERSGSLGNACQREQIETPFPSRCCTISLLIELYNHWSN